MLFGKHIRKYYKKYALLFIFGIIFLIFVDWIQLYIPEFTGKIVDLVNAGLNEESKKTIYLTKNLKDFITIKDKLDYNLIEL